jgi:hypothetical protein
MSHPLEVAAGIVVVAAIGVGALLVLPQLRQPESTSQTIALDVAAPETLRAEPRIRGTNAERVDALQRQLLDIAAEQKRLLEEVRSATEAQAAKAKRRRKKAP